MAIPNMLEAVAELRLREGAVAEKQGRAADGGRCLDDATACAGVSSFIVNEPDGAIRSRLQDLDDRGLARLIELVDVRLDHPELVEEVATFLVGVKAEILAAIDKLRTAGNAGPDQAERAA